MIINNLFMICYTNCTFVAIFLLYINDYYINADYFLYSTFNLLITNYLFNKTRHHNLKECVGLLEHTLRFVREYSDKLPMI